MKIDLKTMNYRRVGQWTLLLLIIFFWIRTIFDKNFFFDFEACCPFGGLQSLATWVVTGGMACNMGGMQILMGALLVLAAIFVSKLFCGYVCPIGTISEGLGRLGKRLKLPKYEMGGITDMAMRSLKYILLFITFYFTIDSNDLFCRKFDPFFASATLFGEDVSTWMATLAIVLLVSGAIFLRQFWCRYLCPLGAISTAFKYVYVFIAFAAVIIALSLTDVQLNYLLILAILTVTAYILELIGLRKNAGFQVLKIVRDEDICIDCGICDKKCPQAINVSKMKEVNHPDCNLCTECVDVCPTDQAIAINGKRKFRWLPLLLTVALIMIGLIFGANLSVPTVNEKWGDEAAMERSKTYEMAGLKHVKCFGSSMTFAEKMKKVPGITATATFIKDHRVVVSYDSTKLTEAQVRRAIFTPKFMDIRIPEDDANVYLTDFHVENFFDELDVVFIANVLKDVSGIYSFETRYGFPVKLRIYSDSLLKPDSVANLIEKVDLVYTTADESFSSKGLYSVTEVVPNDTLMSGAYLKSLSFPSFRRAFNNRSQYSNDQLGRIIFPISEYPRNTQLMPYVINHLGKANEYIVGLIAQYSSNGPVAVVFYVKEMVDEEEIIELMLKDRLTITYDNGVVEKVENPYVFEDPRETNEPDE